MPDTTVILGVTAALLNGFTFVLYSVRTKLGSSNPNPASWFIWAFLATLNALTFREMSGSVVLTLQFFAGSVGCILTFLYVLAIGKFSRPKTNDIWCFAVALAATGVWWYFRSAAWGNVLAVIAFAISFIPTYEGVLRDPSKEGPLPWALWALCFFLATTNVVLQGKEPMALLSPFVLCVAHGGVIPFVTKTRRERFCRA